MILSLARLLALIATLAGSSKVGDSGRHAMNLRVGQRDRNGLALNPDWTGHLPDANKELNGFRLANGRVVGTDDPVTIDQGPGFRGFVCSTIHAWSRSFVSGHINWRRATFSIGRVYWKGYAHDPFEDDDYNFYLMSPNNACATSGNTNHLLDVEFSAHETIDRFQTIWWKKLRDAASGRGGDPAKLVNDLPAIVIGEIGIDTQHGGYAEIHPLHAIAVRTSRSGQTERWSVFVRNWGNEGYCGSNQHLLQTPGNQVTLVFPGASGYNPDRCEMWVTPGVSWTMAKAPEGMAFTVQLTDPQAHPPTADPTKDPLAQSMIHGELVIEAPSNLYPDAPVESNAFLQPETSLGKLQFNLGAAGEETHNLSALISKGKNPRFTQFFRLLKQTSPPVSPPSEKSKGSEGMAPMWENPDIANKFSLKSGATQTIPDSADIKRQDALLRSFIRAFGSEEKAKSFVKRRLAPAMRHHPPG